MRGGNFGQELPGQFAPTVGHVRLAHFLKIDITFFEGNGAVHRLQIHWISGGRAGIQQTLWFVIHCPIKHLRIDGQIQGHHHGVAINLGTTTNNGCEMKHVCYAIAIKRKIISEMLWIVHQTAHHFQCVIMDEQCTGIVHNIILSTNRCFMR